MIKGITGGKYVSVTGGNISSPHISPGATGAGMVRWNSNMNQLEVNDGNSWIAITASYANVELTPEVVELLDWAKERRAEERRVKELCEKYPALQKAKDNFDLIFNIIKDENGQ
jgi:hypothetical protein